MGNYKRNYTDLKSCLEDIFCNEGIECLENGGKLVSMLTDLIPQNRGDINMVKRMAEHGILRDFRKAHAQDEASRNRAVHAAIDKLVNWESIDSGKAESYVRIFAQVMQWSVVITSTVPLPPLQERIPEKIYAPPTMAAVQPTVEVQPPKQVKPPRKRFELTAPKKGEIRRLRTILNCGDRVKKGELLGNFFTTFSAIKIYAPCDGVIVDRYVPDKTWDSKKPKRCQKGELLWIIEAVD